MVAADSAALEQTVNSFLSDGIRTITIDLHGVATIDSVALGVLLRMTTAVGRHGAKLSIAINDDLRNEWTDLGLLSAESPER
jgi:anti-anti-sigma factor